MEVEEEEKDDDEITTAMYSFPVMPQSAKAIVFFQ